jgi:hypothetical protein
MSHGEPTRIERRCGHRFSQYQVPVLLRNSNGQSAAGFTLDLSSRGALLWTDLPLSIGQSLNITLVMPAEITLGEDMSVRCLAKVVRLQPDHARGKPAAAVKIEHYDFVPRELVPVQQHHGNDLHASRP